MYPVQKLGDDVKHIHRAQTEKLITMANLGAEAVAKVIVEGFSKLRQLGKRFGFLGRQQKTRGAAADVEL